MEAWEDYYDIYENNDTGFNMTGGPTCVFGLEPCSITILGNIQLIAFYGIILAASAKIISDGAEMLLDLGLPPAIIGGIVLPLLGAVPDSAMIVASGLGNRNSADTQIAVGMGTLAGSTIMLLTIPWFGGLILGRVDIIRNVGRDGKCSKFTLSSLWKQGVTVTPDVTYSVFVMLITALPYLIVQGADWYFGPAKKMHLGKSEPGYIKYTAITTSIICFIFFFAYLAYLVLYNVASNRRNELRRQEKIKRDVVKRFLLNMQRSVASTVQTTTSISAAPAGTADDDEGGKESKEKKPLLGGKSEIGLQKRYFSAWKVHKKDSQDLLPEEEEEKEVKVVEEKAQQQEEEEEDPKWKIAIKSLAYLVVGVGLVTIFSDPMVGALTRLVDKSNKDSYYMKGGHKVYGQYIPIPVFYLSFIITPICSNASELVSSLLFAAKKKKINSSMTFSQLYGAATMNNTLCLGIFAALVGFRDLTWQYSAEVTVILLIQVVMGVVALVSGFVNHHTYLLLLAFPVVFLYFFSILLVWMLENLLHWK